MENDDGDATEEVERRVNEWTTEMGMTWYVWDGDVAMARRFVRGQAVKSVPSRVGWEGMLVVRRMLPKKL